MFLIHSSSQLPGVYLFIELRFVLANIRHNYSFEDKKPRKNFNKSEEDTEYIMYQSLPTLFIWVNTDYTHIFLKGTGYFL